MIEIVGKDFIVEVQTDGKWSSDNHLQYLKDMLWYEQFEDEDEVVDMFRTILRYNMIDINVRKRTPEDDQ